MPLLCRWCIQNVTCARAKTLNVFGGYPSIMAFQMFDPSIFDSFDLEKIAKESIIRIRQTEKPPISVAAQLQRVLVEVVEAARTGRGAEQAIAAYSDIRQSKQYPRLRARVECHICTSRPSGYRVVCNAQRGDQEMARCSVEVQDYHHAKAYLLAWIQVGEKWIGDTWGGPRPTAPMDENDISDTEHRLWVEDLEDTEAEREAGPGRASEEDN